MTTPVLLTPEQATTLIAVGMLIEGARTKSDNAATIRAQVEALAIGLDSPSVDVAVKRALEAYLPPDIEGGVVEPRRELEA